MFSFRDINAHAHDNEQNTFMALAAMYVEVHPVYQEVAWLREWQAFWMDAAGNQGNGVSDLRPEDHLTDEERIAEFHEFLGDYRSWVTATAPSVLLATGFHAERLVTFTETMEAVLTGDRTHPNVVPSLAAGCDSGGSE